MVSHGTPPCCAWASTLRLQVWTPVPQLSSDPGMASSSPAVILHCSVVTQSVITQSSGSGAGIALVVKIFTAV